MSSSISVISRVLQVIHDDRKIIWRQDYSWKEKHDYTPAALSCTTDVQQMGRDPFWKGPTFAGIHLDSLEHVGHTRRARPSSSSLLWSCRKSSTVWVGGLRVGVRWARTEDAAGLKPTGRDAFVAEQLTGDARWSRQWWNDDQISMGKHVDYRQQHIINPMWDDKPVTKSTGRGWPGNQLHRVHRLLFEQSQHLLIKAKTSVSGRARCRLVHLIMKKSSFHISQVPGLINSCWWQQEMRKMFLFVCFSSAAVSEHSSVLLFGAI